MAGALIAPFNIINFHEKLSLCEVLSYAQQRRGFWNAKPGCEIK